MRLSHHELAVDLIAKLLLTGHPCGKFRRYPVHFLYLMRVMVIRHDARHPSYGVRRRIPES